MRFLRTWLSGAGPATKRGKDGAKGKRAGAQRGRGDGRAGARDAAARAKSEWRASRPAPLGGAGRGGARGPRGWGGMLRACARGECVPVR